MLGRPALRDALALAGVAAAALIVFRRLILDGDILLGFDAFVYFYPLMAYRDARLLAGALPLWTPDYFLGAPFLANPQTGVLYPPNWLTLGLEPPRAYVWQAFGHALLGGAGTYMFLRRALGLGPLAGLAGGLVSALGGFGLSMVGHVNQLQAAAWLGWAALLADRAWLARSPRLGVVLGGVLALQALAGHAQQSFMTAAFLSVWLMARALWLAPRTGAIGPGLVRAVVLLGGAGALAALLAAPQLLPTSELAGQGIRAGGMSYREAAAFSLPPWMLPTALLPVFTGPDQPSSEWLGYVGVVGLVLAALGLVAGRPRAVAWTLGGIALAALLIALGQLGPLYPLLYPVVPGMGLFRVPARWLFVYSFAVAGLVALGLERLRAPEPSGRAVVGTTGLLALFGASIGLYSLAAPAYPVRLPAPLVLAAWAALGVGGLILVGLALRGWPWARPTIGVLLALELGAASQPLELNVAGPVDAYRSMRPTEPHLLLAMERTTGGPYRTLSITDSGFDPGDLALLRSQVEGLLEPSVVDSWVASAKHKDTLTPNLGLRFGIPSLDGYDGGVLPLRSYVGLKTLFPLVDTNLTDGRLGIQLSRLPDPDLLGWLNVRWVVMDRHRDLWADGVYYDLAVRTAVPPGGALVLDGVPPGARASGIGVIAWPGGESAANRLSLEIEVWGDGPEPRRATIPGDLLATAVARRESDQTVAPVRLSLGTVGPVRRVVVRAPLDGVVLGGLALVDDEWGVDWAVPAAPGLRFSALGDVKIYENLRARPRAFLVHGVRPAGDDAEALALLAGGLDTRAAAAVTDACCGWPANPAGPPEPGEAVEIVAYAPERIELQARLTRAGAVVLTDAAYPGWWATVNGENRALRRANGGARALLLEPGDYHIVLAYQSFPLLAGVALATLGAALALVVLLGRFAGRRSQP